MKQSFLGLCSWALLCLSVHALSKAFSGAGSFTVSPSCKLSWCLFRGLLMLHLFGNRIQGDPAKQ